MSVDLRPRSAVIVDLWSDLAIDAPAFTNKAGRPLARTTKCLLDPLVIRPRAHRNLAQALLGPADVDELRGLMADSQTHIENAERWFVLLREHRRRMRITEGNPQELYFPRAFELAVTTGPPGPDAEAHCADTIAEIHYRALPGPDDLAAFVGEDETRQRVCEIWTEGWRADQPAPDDDELAMLAEMIGVALDDMDSDRLADLLEADQGYRFAMAMRVAPGLVDALVNRAGLPRPGLRLSVHDPLQPPAYRGQGELPLDRSFEQRTRSALRRHRELDAAISADEIVADEAERSVAPFGLFAEDGQALFLVGVVASAGLDPLSAHVVEPITRPRLVADLQARLRKEAYVMHLRRELAAGVPIHPRQERVVEELTDFWRPWLNRLWVRLHGRDVTETPVSDEARELLTGITRSVMLDHRQQIRDVLEKVAG
ncbi:hypothetical protein [Enemella sp. A6]|uniref:hypothetical protein n=1 Tax=Enemella sp. A6 TaxID=3440152 RepID=UPI003EC0864D